MTTVATDSDAVAIRSPLRAAEIPELLRALGDIPAERVRLDPPPGMACEQDVVDRVDGDDKILCELVDPGGEANGYREAVLAGAVAGILGSFVGERNLGLVAGADAMMQMIGGNVRLPDVSFTAWEDVPGGKIPTQAVVQSDHRH